MNPPFDPVIFEIPIKMPNGAYPGVHWYGLLIVTGIMLGAYVAATLAKRDGKDPNHIWDMLIIVVVLAVIGARAYHVFSQPSGGLLGWDYYKQYPIEVLYIWQGGLGIYGAIIGGALGVLLYTRFSGLRTLRWLDYAAPGMAIGQSIGRWGNYMNRELYGPPTELPWGLQIPRTYRIPPFNDMETYPEAIRFHPTFLYESLAALLLCFFLIWLATKQYDRLKEGDLLVGYLIGYSTIRFFTEFLRPDAWMAGTLAAAQLFALGFITFGMLFLAIRHWPTRRTTNELSNTGP